jgi:hypothetical protein
MGELRSAYTILVGKPEWKRPLGRPRRRCEDNIRMNFMQVEWKGMNWLHMAQDRDQLCVVVNVMNVQVP